MCVCLSVCLSVCLLSHISLHERAIELQTNMHTSWHINVKTMGIFLKRLRSRVMPRNTSEKANMQINRLTRGQLSPLDAQRNVRGYPGIVKDIQLCPKRSLLTLLARVGARTNCTTRAATTRGVANFRARVLA